MTVPRPADERVCQLVIRCSVEAGAPETLRIRTTFFRELSSGQGEVRYFATVDNATTAVAIALAAFVADAAELPHGSA